MTPDDDDLTPDPQTAADDAADDAHTERWREERARGRAAVEHDAMCPVDLRQRRSDDGCQCGPTSLIARVRADQQQRDMIGFGALPDEDAIRADERERAAGRVERLAATVERILRDEGADSEGGYHSWRCFDRSRYPEPCACTHSVARDITNATLAAIREGGA